MAANIQEALNDICRDIGAIVAVPPLVPARMQTWLNLMFLVPASFPAPGTPFDPQNLDQRSVFDWAVPTLQAFEKINSSATGTVEERNIAIDVVYRTLLAVQTARTENRITANQQTSVVAAYTTSWE